MYKRGTTENDIALIKTTEAFAWSNGVKPICLPEESNRPDEGISRNNFPEKNADQLNDPICVITGFGSNGILNNFI